MNGYLGQGDGFFREIAALTPDPAELSFYPVDENQQNVNTVVASNSGWLNSGQDIRNSQPYVSSVRQAKVNVAMSLPIAPRGSYDPYLGGSRIDLIPYDIGDTSGLLSGGHDTDRVIRNTAAIEFAPWDHNLVWGIEAMHPNLVDAFGIINTAGN